MTNKFFVVENEHKRIGVKIDEIVYIEELNFNSKGGVIYIKVKEQQLEMLRLENPTKKYIIDIDKWD